MTSADTGTVADVRRLIEDRVKAIRAKDVNALVSRCAPDVVSFDVVNPLQYTGADAIRKRADAWFSSFAGPIGFEIRDLSVAAGDDMAFCHGLSGVNGTRTDGAKIGMWYRTTICYRRVDGRWMITHEHNSVPFNVENGKASLDLKPD
ncbi:MAG TPA: SgcJ/EcaC family oxidoreductase [bacterium]|nr:SgcJ/EcaC family oxidoreductase [bacterium]